MFMFPIILIFAPGIMATVYYLRITERETVPPVKLAGLIATFVFLCNLFSMLVTFVKWNGKPLTVLGVDAVWRQLQFSVKYMLLSVVAAILLPWFLRWLSRFNFKDFLDSMTEDEDGESMTEDEEDEENENEESAEIAATKGTKKE